jgi:hypothetical protein
MRFRKAVTFFMLATGLVFALSAWAQQKPVAPGFSPARVYVAASLPRHGGVKPRLRHADPSTSSGQALKVSATTATSSPAKPITQEQVSNMVRDGFGDELGAKLIEQRGIDFAPSGDFLQSLKAAGARYFLRRCTPPSRLSPPARRSR